MNERNRVRCEREKKEESTTKQGKRLRWNMEHGKERIGIYWAGKEGRRLDGIWK